MNKPVKYSPEVRDRAVRMVLEHQDGHGSQWAAIESIAGKIGCTAETLRLWVRRAERDQGKLPGLTTDERARMKALERENRELRQANEILRKADGCLKTKNILVCNIGYMRHPYGIAIGCACARQANLCTREPRYQ